MQLEFAPAAKESLDKIIELSGARTNAEVIRSALAFYQWGLEEKSAGHPVGSQIDSTFVRILFN